MDTFPTLDYEGKQIPNPSLPVKESVKSNTLIISFESGHEQRRAKSAPMYVWELNYVVLTDSAYKKIRDFYLTHTDEKAFYWSHPLTKVRWKVRFSANTFQASNFTYNIKTNLWSANITLNQVF